MPVRGARRRSPRFTPRCVSALLPLHFNIFQRFNIYDLCRFVLLISYSWPEEMHWRVLKRVRTLFLQSCKHAHAAPCWGFGGFQGIEYMRI